MNTLHFYFEPTSTPADELVLIHGKAVKSFGQWSEYMRVQLNQEEFKSVLNGVSRFRLKKKFHQSPYSSQTSDITIRKNTYRVYINDGKDSQVLYVSKIVPERMLLNILNINQTKKISDKDLFFNSQEQGPFQWFQRNLKNGDKVFVWLDIGTLKKNFLNKFKKQKINLARVNGVPKNTLNLKNKENAKIYLRIRPERTMRTFSEHKKIKAHPSTGDSCMYYIRKISAEVSIPVTLDDFFQNLASPYIPPLSEMKIMEQEDEKGFFWEIMFSSVSENLNLALTSRAASTYTTTGQYRVKCRRSARGRSAAFRTNEEGKLSFEIESFVEKLTEKTYN